MRSKLALVVFAVLTVGGFSAAACGVTPSTSATALGPTATPFVIAQPTAPPTAAPAAQIANRTVGLKFSGNLISATQANVAFEVSGRVTTLAVKEGDRVKKDQPLIMLDTTLLQMQVSQAQAAFDLAQANFDKVKQGPTLDDITVAKMNVNAAKASLAQAQAAYDRMGGDTNPYIVASPAAVALQQASSAYQSALAQLDSLASHPTDPELRMAQAQMDQAHSALDLAKQNLVYATLVSPMDGAVVKLYPKAGEFVGAGTPVVTLADLDHMQVQVNLDETSLAAVKLNQPVTLTLDALAGRELTGRVSKIAYLGNSAGGLVSVPVTIDVDPTDAPIYPGLSALVSFQP